MGGGDTGGTTPPSAVVPTVATVSRRGLLGAGLAASALLAGCGLRLDLPRPAPPVPTRQRVPDEAFLVLFVQDLRGLEALARALPESERARAGVRDALRVLADQDDVLTGRLTNTGVPTAVIDGTATQSALPSHSATAAGTSTTAATGGARPTSTSRPPSFATELGDLPEGRWESLAATTVANRSVLLSATSARLASAIRLGRAVAVPGNGSQTLHTALVEHTAPLVYGFEVVAAQSVGADRNQALKTLGELRRLLAEVGPLLPGSALPGGWSLPYPVTTPAEAKRLARDLLAHAIDATTSLLPPTPSTAGVAEAATWSARVQALGPAHGIPLDAFPGTSGAARP